MKRPVIAADINNLTDARYFASWGVDYLLFDLATISIEEIKVIVGWVEGVKVLIWIDSHSLGSLDEVIVKLSPYAVGAQAKSDFGRLIEKTSGYKVFYWSPETLQDAPMIIISESENIDAQAHKVKSGNNFEAFSTVSFDQKGLKEFLSKSDTSIGVVIKGGLEIATGLKQFEETDSLLEILDEE
jgi:hypothetical protein